MADLTQQEFLDIADIYPEEINLWCTSEPPVTTLGVTVPFIDNENTNVRNTLQQIETITLPVDNDSGTTVQLAITSRVIRGVSPYEYFFFTVEPRNINSYVNPTANEVVQDGEVILSPNLRGGSFFTSNYNVVLNTTQNSRTSDYIQQSTSTTLASVQDSLYSDTGWINARYDGSSTNNLTYASIDSAIQGASFQGTYYPGSTPDIEIQNLDVSERSYTEYFHTALQPYPTYGFDYPPRFLIEGNQVSTTSTSISVKPYQYNKPFKTYQPGDLVVVESNAPILEVLKVVSITRLSANNDYNLEVIRGWNGTPRAGFIDQASILNINTVRIFELEGNKPSPVKQGKIRIKDTGDIVSTDLLGYVVSGSLPTN
jgi:hypothetical protein